MVELNPKQFLGGPPPLGEILVSQGLIQREQLFQALAYKDEHGLFLGQALVALRFMTEEDLVRALRSQQRFDAIHLTPDIVDPAVAKELGYEHCSEFGCIPLNRIAGHVTVAMEDPSNLLKVQELTGHLKTRVLPVFAEPRRIQEALRVHFGRTVAEMSPAELRRRVDQLSRELALAAARDGAAEGTRTPDPLVVELVDAVLTEAFAQAARAVHVESTSLGVRLRYRGEDGLTERFTLPKDRAREVVGRLRVLAGLDGQRHDLPQDGRTHMQLAGRQVELCIATAPSVHGDCAVVEFVENVTAGGSWTGSGLSEEQRALLLELCADGEGLVLAAGPVRAGKQTFLRSLLGELDDPHRMAVALEERAGDPLADVVHLRYGVETGIAASVALRAALRMDPDVVYVGELRDRQATAMATQAALTGRLVLSSVSTLGALDTVQRLRDLGVEPHHLADALRAAVGLRLVRRLCATCRIERTPDADELARLAAEATDDAPVFEAGEGCMHCRGTGYTGHVGLFEVLPITPALRALLADGASPARLARAAYDEGFVDLRASGLSAARAGTTSLSQVLAATSRGGSRPVPPRASDVPEPTEPR